MNNLIEKCQEDKIICVICLDEIDEKYKKEEAICKCIESIHKSCLEEWLKINNSCPLCRKKIKKEEEINNNLYFNDLQIQHTYYNNDEIELIEIYEDRRIRLQKVKYLLRLASIILITTGIFSGANVIQKIINLL